MADVAAKSETQKWMEGAYAQFRLDGCTHEQAMTKIKAAMDAAIPQAVKVIMDEIRGPPPPPPICRACNGFGYDAVQRPCPDCTGKGRVSTKAEG